MRTTKKLYPHKVDYTSVTVSLEDRLIISILAAVWGSTKKMALSRAVKDAWEREKGVEVTGERRKRLQELARELLLAQEIIAP